jgi:serine/threonine protein kinase
MLVYSRDPFHIKLTDFGLLRVSKDLTICCGIALYLIPEVYKSEKYALVVDIWSLGIVVFQFAYGLPNCDIYSGRR